MAPLLCNGRSRSPVFLADPPRYRSTGARGRGAACRRPRDRHAREQRRHEREARAAMNGSRARSHPARTAAGRGREAGSANGLTFTVLREGGQRTGAGNRVRLLLLLLRTSTGRADTAGHAGAGQTDHCLSRMRFPPVLGPQSEGTSRSRGPTAQ